MQDLTNPTPQETTEETPPAATNENPENNQEDITQIENGIRKDEAMLSVMSEQYAVMSDKISDEFESVLTANPTALFTPEELEILASDSNIAEKNKMLRAGFEKFRNEKLNIKKEEMEKFEEQLTTKKSQFDIYSESSKFSKENPTVDMQSLADFIQEDLTPRKKREFREQTKTKYEFLVLANEEFQKQNKKDDGKDDDDNLPPDLSSVNGATGNGGYSAEEDKRAYHKSIGIGR